MNTKRAAYIVKNTSKSYACDELGDSKDLAIKDFHPVEKRFKKDTNLKVEYNKFMKKYHTLGYLNKIDNINNDLSIKKINILNHTIQLSIVIVLLLK